MLNTRVFLSFWILVALADPAATFANWVQSAKLTADDGAAYDRFGYCVDVGGNTAIVGAWYDDENGSGSGSAYLFDITSGLQLAKLTADDGQAGDHLGWSVAISGNTAIVGAQGDDDNGMDSGSAYLFDVEQIR